MITGGWAFVTAAYAITSGALVVLVATITLGARRWAKEAEKLDKP